MTEKEEQLVKLTRLFFHCLWAYENKKEEEIHLSEDELLHLMELAKRHSLTALLYVMLKNVPQLKDNPNLLKLRSSYSKICYKAAQFETERQKVYSFMNEKGIDFLPLKGILIQDDYPEFGIREFADNDILFDAKYAKDIKDYFLSNGYVSEDYGKGAHDVYQKKPFYNFEMHRMLFDLSEDNKVLNERFSSFLMDSPIKEGKEHVLSNEDFLFYFTAHTYKHFRGFGLGLRTIVDYHYYLKNHNDIKEAEVLNKLKSIELDGFFLDFLSLTKALAEEKELTKENQDMLLYILSSGTYGTMKNYVSGKIRKQGKKQYVLKRLFPPMSYYKAYYPRAYKSKIGIPFIWIYRLFRAMTVSRKKVKTELQVLDNPDTEEPKTDSKKDEKAN